MHIELVDKDTIRVKIEKFEDLIGLFIFINPGDIVFGFDYRTIKINETKKEKIKVYLEIEVEKIKFGQYMNSIRIQGRIIKASDIVQGKYHTFDIKVGDIINIKKKKLTKNDIEFLKRYERSFYGIYILSLDDREFSIAEITDFKYKILYNEEFNIPKDDPERESRILKIISNGLKKINNPKLLILSGPLFYPDVLENYVNRFLDDRSIKIRKIKTSHGGSWGIREVIKRKEFSDILNDIEISMVNLKIQDLMRYLDKGLVALGYEKVKENIDMGNVEYILISFDYFRKLKEDGRYLEIISLIEPLNSINAEYFFVYRDNEYYDFINKFGVVAKLRYKI